MLNAPQLLQERHELTPPHVRQNGIRPHEIHRRGWYLPQRGYAAREVLGATSLRDVAHAAAVIKRRRVKAQLAEVRFHSPVDLNLGRRARFHIDQDRSRSSKGAGNQRRAQRITWTQLQPDKIICFFGERNGFIVPAKYPQGILGTFHPTLLEQANSLDRKSV